MNTTAVLVTAATLLVSQVAFANDATTNTGNELVTLCSDASSQANGWQWQYCIAFIDGVAKGIDAGADISLYQVNKHYTSDEEKRYRSAFVNFCIPDNVTRQQKALVVSKYLHDHPEELNQSDYVEVLLALVTAWPCPKS